MQDAAYEPMRSKQTQKAVDWKVISRGMNGDQDAPRRPTMVR